MNGESADPCLRSHSTGLTLQAILLPAVENEQLNELLAKMSEMWTKFVFMRYVT